MKGVNRSSNARAVLDQRGLFVSGELKTLLARVDLSGDSTKLSGNSTKAGVDLRSATETSKTS